MRTAEKTILKFDFSAIWTKKKIKEDWFIGTSFYHVSAFFVIFKKSSIVAWVVLIKLELLSATIWQTRITTHLSSFSRAHASLWNFQKTSCRYFAWSFYPEICQLTTLFLQWINLKKSAPAAAILSPTSFPKTFSRACELPYLSRVKWRDLLLARTFRELWAVKNSFRKLFG